DSRIPYRSATAPPSNRWRRCRCDRNRTGGASSMWPIGWSEALRDGATLFAPLFLGMVAHGLCIRFGLLRGLAVPIDGGRRWRGKRLFGDNKTYRGIVA